ncbi:MAG TPA: hypothetical protein VE861_13955, partial [Gemmatimonadaceae bacterium]|nr:hypothetical protein [Gemmatimonadaceae bacterium]
MSKTGILRGLSAGMVTAFLAGCADSTAAPNDLGLATGSVEQSFIVLSTGAALPATFGADVAALGGTITSSSEQIGMATVELKRTNARALLAKVRGVGTVAQDVVMQFTDPNQPFESVEVAEDAIEVAEGG